MARIVSPFCTRSPIPVQYRLRPVFRNTASARCFQHLVRPLLISTTLKSRANWQLGRVMQAVANSSTPAAREVSRLEELREKGDSYFVDDSRPIILYDGVCNMCNGTVNFVLDRDGAGLFRFAALQSGPGKALLVRSGRAPDFMESVVLATKDTSYQKSEAILQIAKVLKLPLSDMALLSPLFMRDSIYDVVAENRYSVFGKSETCRITDGKFKARFLSD